MSDELIIGHSGTTTTANCITGGLFPYTTSGSYISYQTSDGIRMGEFDIHLDRTGILRVFKAGKMVAELKADKR